MNAVRHRRLVVHNVGGVGDPRAIHDVLAGLDPDVVCLLGAPSPRRLRAVLRGTGLSLCVRGGQRGESSAILVRSGLLVRSTDRLRLVAPRRVPDREAVRAIVSVGGTSVAFVAVQFGFRPDVRATNLQALRTWLSSVSPPTVIGAFVSEPASGPVASTLASEYQDAFAVAGSGVGDTYPSDEPVSRRDFAFVDRRLQIDGCVVDAGPRAAAASRHRPVVVDLDLRDDAGVARG